MSLILRYRYLAALAVVWVFTFSATALPGMVICFGQDGHLAIEPVHDDQNLETRRHCQPVISIGDCGDCSDTPLFAFYGILRIGTGNGKLWNTGADRIAALESLPFPMRLYKSADNLIIPAGPSQSGIERQKNIVLIC
jgi:hypothetical protein